MFKILSNIRTKQELLDYVTCKYEKYKKDKTASKLKRIIFNTYNGKYIFYKNEKFKVNKKSLDNVYNMLKEKKQEFVW